MLKSLYLIFILTFLLSKENLVGRVRLLGTEIFPDLVITTSEQKNYYFDKHLFNDYIQYLGKDISIRARVKKEKLWLADRSKSFYRYTIVSVDKIE